MKYIQGFSKGVFISIRWKMIIILMVVFSLLYIGVFWSFY